MLDLVLVVGGAIFFFIAVFAQYIGVYSLISIVQKLWKPFFLPTITILVSASLFEGLLNWWKRQVLQQEREK